MVSKLTGAGPDDYDGVPYEALHFDVIVWPNPDHIRKRSQRTGNPGETDLEPEWANEAVQDPFSVRGPGMSKSGLSVRVIGRSHAAARILAVYVVPADRPPGTQWIGATAHVASRRERAVYAAQREGS
jgi:hypothetical protein